MNTITIPVQVAADTQTYAVKVSAPRSISVGMDTAIQAIISGRYEGPYTATPGPEPQTIPTEGLFMEHDFTVAAIPNNYGLITWNGSVLTVS